MKPAKWSDVLNDLEVIADERDALVASCDLNVADAVITDDRAIAPQPLLDSELPNVMPRPNAAERARAARLLGRLDTQRAVLEGALATTMRELQHVARQRGPRLSRLVATDNAGGFEARA